MSPLIPVTATSSSEQTRPPRGAIALSLIAVVCLFAFSGLIALGTWQLQRLSWKLDLIERVESRIHAPAVPAPASSGWPQVSAARDEYRHVRLTGHYLSGKDTRVQAVTALGSGFWILSPLQLVDGSIVLVNRGFIPSDWRRPVPPASTATITGLLRISEPGGGFLRRNDATTDRWYSRDTIAIGAARGLQNVAPFFVDADAAADATEWPRSGLTVTHFSNNHLGYALTWFALALMVLWGGWRVFREELALRRRRQRAGVD